MNRSGIKVVASVVLLLASTSLLSQQSGPDYEDLLSGFADPERWLTYSGDYSGTRHSPLTQITPDNVHELQPIWTFQTGTTTRGRGFETSPLVDDGVLYVTPTTTPGQLMLVRADVSGNIGAIFLTI